MPPEEFRAACLILWGPEYRTKARAFLSVSDRNLSRFCSGDKIVGPDFEDMLLNMIRVLSYGAPTPVMAVMQRALKPTRA